MRVLVALIVSLGLAACSKNEQAERDEMNTVFENFSQAEEKTNAAQFAKIEYPTCAKPWEGEKLSKCGEAVFRTSMAECGATAQERIGGAAVELDEYAGDSWLMRAGPAVWSLEKRIQNMHPRSVGPRVESLAYALGNGTDDIAKAYCQLSENLRLQNITIDQF